MSAKKGVKTVAYAWIAKCWNENFADEFNWLLDVNFKPFRIDVIFESFSFYKNNANEEQFFFCLI